MDLLYILEDLRTPVLDAFFSVVTLLGSETLFLAIAIVVFWCVNKRTGYYLMATGFFGTLINQFLKLVCQVPRPWVKDPEFTIVESAREEATGYSFPSGHTQSVTAVLGCPAKVSKNKWVKTVSIILILLTALSRMYLGVHTPMDVGVSLVIGTALLWLLYPVYKKSEEKPEIIYYVFGALTVLSLAYVIFVELNKWPADIDTHNLESGVKNGYLLLGCGCAIMVSSFIERKFINFDTKAPIWAQILKTALGLVLVLGIKEGLKPVLDPIFSGHIAATALRYFLVVVFAACVWPMTFKWFAAGCPMNKKIKIALIVLLVIVLLIAAVVAFALWFVHHDTWDKPVPTDGAENPLITPLGVTMLSGHRAGGGLAPENTMMALRSSAESDEYELDIFEFDVHMTSDGVLVLLHDESLDRTSDAVEHFGMENVLAADHTLAELRELNMGEFFKNSDGEMPYAGLRGDDIPQDLRITSLEEALEYLESAGDFQYIIEIKNSGELGYRATDELYRILKEYGALDRTVVGTFHNEITAYVDTTYPDMMRSAGYDECEDFFICATLNKDVGDDYFDFVALQIPTYYDVSFIEDLANLGTSKVINYAHKYGIAVQYWTINDPEEMARLQSIGADAIMTDVPDVGAEVLNQP